MTRSNARLSTVIVLVIWMVALPAAGQLRILFVDQTQTFETSLRLEVLARRLKASGVSTLPAQLAIPESPWEGETYQFAVILPADLPFIWLCTPGTDAVLPDSLLQPKAILSETLAGAFDGIRDVFGVSGRRPGRPALVGLPLAAWRSAER